MMPMRETDVPLYVQVKQYIRGQIEKGDLTPHDALPGERELSSMLGLSRTTVRQALTDLVIEGVLYRHHGKGTFVAPRRHEPNLASLTGFAEQLRLQNISVVTDVLTTRIEPATDRIAEVLHIAPKTEIAFVTRLMWTDATPLCIDRTYLIRPLGDTVLQADLTETSIYDVAERNGYPIKEGLQTIRAISLNARDADLLQRKPGSPALCLQRTTFMDDDVPIEYSEALYRADRFQYETRLLRHRPPLPR